MIQYSSTVDHGEYIVMEDDDVDASVNPVFSSWGQQKGGTAGVTEWRVDVFPASPASWMSHEEYFRNVASYCVDLQARRAANANRTGRWSIRSNSLDKNMLS